MYIVRDPFTGPDLSSAALSSDPTATEPNDDCEAEPDQMNAGKTRSKSRYSKL